MTNNEKRKPNDIAKNPTLDAVDNSDKPSVRVGHELDLAIFHALEGATETMARFTELWNQHREEVDPLLEVMKGRVKARDKIREKIELKRQNKEPQYCVQHVEDLIGFRFNTLFRSDCLKIVDHLVRIIMKLDGYENSLFPDNALLEVVYYPSSDPQYAEDTEQKLKNVLSNAECDHQAILTPPKTKQSGYSSIHLIAQMNRPKSHDNEHITVEFQVRSNFENVWAQIEHRLSYKFKDEVAISKENKLAAIKCAKTLKKQVDACDETAEHIRGLMKFQTGGFFSQENNFTPNTIDQQIFSKSRIRKHFDSAWIENVDSVLKEFSKLNNATADQDIIAPETLEVEELIRLADTLEKLLDDIEPFQSKSPRAHDAIEALKMELALLHLMVGTFGNAFDRLLEAQSIYESIAGRMSSHPIYFYRRARLAGAMKQTVKALALANEAQEAMERYFEENDEPEFLWLKYDLPRYMSILIWNDAGRMIGEQHSKGSQHQDRDGKTIAELMTQAMRYSIIALNEASEAEASHASTESLKNIRRSKVASLNNVLYYAMFLQESADAPAKVEGKSIKTWKKLAASQLAIDNAETIANANRAAFADTARAYHDLEGNAKLALLSAHKALELIENEQCVHIPNWVSKEIRRDAGLTIAKYAH